MEELNILTRVIQTQPQSFIEGNIERICFLLTGANPINNKDISLSLIDTGGFQFTNLLAQTSNRYIGNAFKDKDDFLTKIKDYFSRKNEAFTKAFSNQKNDFSFPFFPLQYMKPVAAYPNLEKNEFGKVIRSWTAIYKIEIPAYDNPNTRQTEYANVSNAGIEITVCSEGQLIALKYNLLPFEERKGVSLFKVVADENEIPQLTYLLNKETNTVTPFYLATTEEAYIPATRESILPKSNDNEILFHNPTDFDRSRIVVWLKRIGLKRRLKVKDASSTKESSNNNIQVPVGAKLIRLKPNNASDETTPCIYWLNGSYHQSFVPEANLGTNNVVLSDFAGQVVKNDVEHLINRISEYEKKQMNMMK